MTFKPKYIYFCIKISWKVSCVLSHCRYYAIMVTMFFTVSVMNNYALNLNIAMPLHMIFRSVSASSHVCPLKSMVKGADQAWDRNSRSYRKSSLGHNDRFVLSLWTGWESGKWMAFIYLRSNIWLIKVKVKFLWEIDLLPISLIWLILISYLLLKLSFTLPHPCLAAFCFVVQAGLEVGPQPQPPECGVYGLVPSCSRIIVDQGDFSQNDDPFSLFLCDELSL